MGRTKRDEVVSIIDLNYALLGINNDPKLILIRHGYGFGIERVLFTEDVENPNGNEYILPSDGNTYPLIDLYPFQECLQQKRNFPQYQSGA